MLSFLLPLLGAASGFAEQDDTTRTLSADEVTDLFADRTVVGEVVRLKRVFKAYYRADGVFKGIKKDGRWMVTDEGQHCLKYGKKTVWSCGRMVVTGEGIYQKLIPAPGQKGREIPIVSFRSFTPGNVDNL